MKYKLIGDLRVSEMALGAGGRGDVRNDPISFKIMDHYIGHGGNCFDTARIYGNGASDEALGRWLRQSKLRNEIYLCTKGNHPDLSTMHIARLSPKEIEDDLDASLRAIGTDYTDLHLLHRDDPKIPVEDIMPAMDQLVRSGRVRVIGCSNWTIGRIHEANQFALENGLTPFSLCQIHHSLAVTTPAQTRDITHVPMSGVEYRWYRRTQFPIMAFSTQARGFFSAAQSGADQKQNNIQYYGKIPENLERAGRLIELAGTLGAGVAELAVSYVKYGGLNAVVLGAFSSTQQMDMAVRGLNIELTAEQVRYLESGE